VLHWVGDSSALARTLYPAQTYTLADPLDQALRHSLDHPVMLEIEQVLAAPRGAALLSTPLVVWEGALYYPHWQALEGEPVLRRVGNLADLVVLGVRPEDVVDAGTWPAAGGGRVLPVEAKVPAPHLSGCDRARADRPACHNRRIVPENAWHTTASCNTRSSCCWQP
jgi:hypothetical protein